MVGQGDEAIVFDPAYDAYDPGIRLAGGRCVHIPLAAPDFRFDWDRVRAAINDRTRLIIINNPHNPACTVASAEDLDMLAALTRDRPITVLGDEVYEHVLYDGRQHQSVMNHEELQHRSFAAYSFGKTLHITGWRVGYCVAPPHLTRELRKVHQFNTFSVSSPAAGGHCAVHAALPAGIPRVWRISSAPSARCCCARCPAAGWCCRRRRAAISSSADYSQLDGCLASLDDVQFTEKLINEAGVAVDPAVAVLPRAATRTCASCACAWPSVTKRWLRPRGASARTLPAEGQGSP